MNIDVTTTVVPYCNCGTCDITVASIDRSSEENIPSGGESTSMFNSVGVIDISGQCDEARIEMGSVQNRMPERWDENGSGGSGSERGRDGLDGLFDGETIPGKVEVEYVGPEPVGTDDLHALLDTWRERKRTFSDAGEKPKDLAVCISELEAVIDGEDWPLE